MKRFKMALVMLLSLELMASCAPKRTVVVTPVRRPAKVVVVRPRPVVVARPVVVVP